MLLTVPVHEGEPGDHEDVVQVHLPAAVPCPRHPAVVVEHPEQHQAQRRRHQQLREERQPPEPAPRAQRSTAPTSAAAAAIVLPEEGKESIVRISLNEE